MSNKHFNKELPHCCEYCVHGNNSEFSGEVICIKRGVTDAKDCCRKYKYDPLKREPARQKISDNYRPEDFSL